ncbi:MAG: hypothetical protein AB7I30_23420, partial [Isosphaeraceae bacterium]
RLQSLRSDELVGPPGAVHVESQADDPSDSHPPEDASEIATTTAEPDDEMERYSRIAPAWNPEHVDPAAEDRASKLFGETPGGHDRYTPDPHATAVSQIYDDYEHSLPDDPDVIEEHSTRDDSQHSWTVAERHDHSAIEDRSPRDHSQPPWDDTESTDDEERSAEFAALDQASEEWAEPVEEWKAAEEWVEDGDPTELARARDEPIAPSPEEGEPCSSGLECEEEPLLNAEAHATLESSADLDDHRDDHEDEARPTGPPPTPLDHEPEPAAPVAIGRVTAMESESQARSASMSQSGTMLSQELAELSDRFSELGERLLAAARQLHSPGLPPSDELLDGLASCRQEFLDLRDRSFGLAGSIPIACPLPEEVESLEDLNGLLERVSEAESRQSKLEEHRRDSLLVIDRFLLISHASTPDFAPLAECHEKARALRRAIGDSDWSSLPEEVESLASGEHPYACLVGLISDRDELDDEEWARLHETVGQHLGKSLAAAAARAKLVMRAAPEGSATSSEVAYAEGR